MGDMFHALENSFKTSFKLDGDTFCSPFTLERCCMWELGVQSTFLVDLVELVGYNVTFLNWSVVVPAFQSVSHLQILYFFENTL